MSAIAIEAARRYIEIGRPERALESLSQLDVDEDIGAVGLCLRGSALLAMERYDDAAATARDGLRAAPQSTDLRLLLSRVEAARGHLAEAEAAVLAALAIEPDRPALLVHYADLLMRGGELRKARRVLDAAGKDSLEALQKRVTLAYLRGRDREANRLRAQLIAARR